MRHPALADRRRACLVVVDVQEKLVPLIREHTAMLEQIGRLVAGCRRLDVPVLVTEQYPRGIGPTVEVIRAAVGDAPTVEKTTFSCMGEPDFRQQLEAIGRDQLLLCGIETHICVGQTAFDAAAAGRDVQVIADAVGSRFEHTRALGLGRLDAAGIQITSTEAVLFELMERSDIDEFKAVQALIR